MGAGGARWRLFQQSVEERKECAAAVAPVAEFVQAVQLELAVGGGGGGGEGGGELLELAQAFLAVGEPGLDFLAHEAGGEAFDFDLGGEVVAAVAGLVDEFDGSEGAEELEALAGGAFAHGEALAKGVEGQRLGGNEEEAVDFPDGFGQAEDADGADEEVDDADFQFRQFSRGGGAGAVCGLEVGHGGSLGEVGSLFKKK